MGYGVAFAAALVGLLVVTRTASASEHRMGPLRVHPTNPRYFADGDGNAVYLTGSHTWSNLKDLGVTDPPEPFDFGGYLDFLAAMDHNFIRLWTWELSKYRYTTDGLFLYAAPFPWQRTGPGLALDGKPKFDLTRLDDAYFERLRARVAAARERGIYVAVMLFEGHGVQQSTPPWRWDGHPFHPANNVNGIDGDPNADGRGTEVHTLEVPAITRVQEAYVRRVVEAVNEYDNVLYEITNEAGPYSTDWQYHVIRFVKECEASRPYQHPVGMTFQYSGGSNAALFASPADWVSPNPEGGYREAPPAADGSKVIINDTDHLWGIGGNAAWVWKSFLAGMNPIYMDPFDTQGFRSDDSIRLAMGATLRLARRLRLDGMTPSPDLSTSGFCLAGPSGIAAWAPGGSVALDLASVEGAWAVEWIHPITGASEAAGSVSGGARREFQAPVAGDAVLFLAAQE